MSVCKCIAVQYMYTYQKVSVHFLEIVGTNIFSNLEL